jgi:16S rRNA (cytosine967-C5)-methyltransferase
VALPGLGDLTPVLEAGAEPGPLAPDSALYHGGDAGRLPGVREGAVRVQDVGSQLTARALAGVDPQPGKVAGSETVAGERWLDLCAGPGGKAALMAALAHQHGATLLANEIAEHRARLVEQALVAVPKAGWTVRCGDGRDVGAEVDAGRLEPFDRILVDAPCTGLGSLRRRPESRWRRQPSDLGPLTELQRQLLDSAVTALAPGGILGYVTCSPHPAETVFQVQDLLKRNPGLELLDAAGALAAVATGDVSAAGTAGAPGTAQLWPHLHSTDAMFMALFRKGSS